MAHYAISMQDGSVALMQTVGEATAEECLAKWAPEQRDAVALVRLIDPSRVPASREFRNAWTLQGLDIVHDMDKAKAIQRERLRVARVQQFDALDLAYLRADEAGDSTAKAAVVAQKQALRDAPQDPALDSARTVEELSGLTLEALIPASLRPLSA